MNGLGIVGGLIALVATIAWVSAVCVGCAGCVGGSFGQMDYGLHVGTVAFPAMIIGGILYVLGGGKLPPE